MTQAEYEAQIRGLLAGHRGWLSDGEDMGQLAANMLIVEQIGLTALNDRLVRDLSGFLDALAEHRLAVGLHLSGFNGFAYEVPTYEGKNVDLGADKNGRNYRVEVKRLGEPEDDQAARNWKRALEDRLRNVPSAHALFVTLGHSLVDVDGLAKTIRRVAEAGPETAVEYLYPAVGKPQADFKFFERDDGDTLTVRIVFGGVAYLLDGTRRVERQVRKGYEKFKGLATPDASLNIVALEMDGFADDAEVANVLFGTAEWDGEGALHRRQNGLFCNDKHSRLAGVITTTRTTPRLSSRHKLKLFVNPLYSADAKRIADDFQVSAVIGQDTFVTESMED